MTFTQSTRWAFPIRKAEDGGEFVLLGEHGHDIADAARFAERTNDECGAAWERANPVQRVVHCTVELAEE